MEGFGKPSLPPPPPSSSNANQEIGDTRDEALAEIPSTQEVSRAEVPPVDPDHEKKLKRILATREYSRRYQNKKLQRIENLEAQLKERETEIAVTSPRVRFTKRTNMLLRAENDAIQQKLATCTGKLMMKQAEHKELLKERDSLKQVLKMQQAGMAFNPLVQPGYYMSSNPPAQPPCQVFGTNFGPSYPPYNPPAALDPATVDFGLFPAPVAADQFDIEPPRLDNQLRSDPAGLNRQPDEPVGFSEFTNELSLIVRPHIMPDKGAGDGDGQSSEGMNLDDPNDSQKAPGSSSYKFM